MAGIGILFFIVIALGISFLRGESHKSSIERYIQSLGGRVMEIERRHFFSGIGPFHVVGKGRVIYRILYIVGDHEREGWVRFGSLFSPDWRL